MATVHMPLLCDGGLVLLGLFEVHVEVFLPIRNPLLDGSLHGGYRVWTLCVL